MDHVTPQGQQEPEEVSTCVECPDVPPPQIELYPDNRLGLVMNDDIPLGLVIDPHLPERPEAVAIARSIYSLTPLPEDQMVEPPAHLPVAWHGKMTVEKYHGEDTTADPYEVIESGQIGRAHV